MSKKIYKDVKKFVIDRSKWLRGQGSINSYLLDNEGKMCCLGFYAQECGLRPQDIKNVAEPITVVVSKKKDWNSFLIATDGAVDNSPDTWKLMEINDDPKLDDKVREKFIKDRFAEHDIKVKFIGK